MISIDETDLKEKAKEGNTFLKILASFVFGMVNLGSWLGGWYVGVMGFAHWLYMWGNPEALKIAYTGALVSGIWLGAQIILSWHKVGCHLLGLEVEEDDDDEELTSVAFATSIQTALVCMLIYFSWNANFVDNSPYQIDSTLMKGMLFGMAPFVVYSFDFPDDITILRKLGLGKWMDVTIKWPQ